MHMSKRDKFIEAGIPYDDIDSEMIHILDVLNFNIGIKTKFCCYGHSRHEDTYIMFADDETDENVLRLLKAVDNNIGTSGISGVKLYKWARMMYQGFYQEPHYPVLNWVLRIDGVQGDELRAKRLSRITVAIDRLNIIL